MDAEGYVREWVHIARSSRSTVWLLRLGPPKGDTGDRVRARTLYELVADLRDIGCTVVDFESMGCFSVDVPEAVPLQNVDAILDRKGAEVAVAFPSLRHTELLGP
jgi:hypothetical protein